ncbi:DUF6528 family protein [Streptomyces sp. NPDC018045]|uniref:DUF6528 family protein n=1 Tax=Streptomyces sp. NPDC018045 TaxID=3365037 RepID=UPI0037884841
MSIDRRRLLTGAAGVAAAGTLGALGAGSAAASGTSSSAQTRGPVTGEARAQAFDLALLDVNRNTVDVFSSGGQFTDDNLKQRLTFPGQDPLECRLRAIPHSRPQPLLPAFLACGGFPGRGWVSIHSNDGTRLWSDGLTNYPHCVEYLEGTGAFVVAGSRGGLQLYVSDSSSVASIRKIGRPYPFPKAHGVLWDPKYQVLWAHGGRQLVPYKVTGTQENTRLAAQRPFWAGFRNGHDIQPDYTDDDILIATDSDHVYRIDKTKSGVQPEIISNRKWVKGYSRHPSGQGVWTAAPQDGSDIFGTDEVHFSWPEGLTRRPGGKIYKARLMLAPYQ